MDWEKSATEQPVSEEIELQSELIKDVPCLWIQKRNKKSRGVVLYLHGGGLVSGSVLTHRNLVAALAEQTTRKFLAADYRLLPENAFPAPLEDASDVYTHLIGCSDCSSREITIMGDSSGAGLALALLQHLRDQGAPQPKNAVLISGVYDMNLAGDSLSLNDGKDPTMNYKGLVEWKDRYFVEPLDARLSPLKSDLSDLPPILFLAGGYELWLSDSIAAFEKIKAGGGKARLEVYEMMGHVWIMDTKAPESKKAIRHIRDFLESTET